MRERDEIAFDRAFGEVERGRPPDGLEGGLAGTLERFDQRAELPAGRRAVEAAHTDVDRMDLAPADECHHFVTRLLQGETTLDRLGRVAGQLDRAGVAEEIGRVQHVDVERMALDPLAAVEKPAKDPDRLRYLDAAQVLERVDGTRLVGDRADAADPGRDVRRLDGRTAAEERLEETRRLEDPQLDVLDLAVLQSHGHRTLAFDPSEIVGLDHTALSHGSSPPLGMARRSR